MPSSDVPSAGARPSGEPSAGVLYNALGEPVGERLQDVLPQLSAWGDRIFHRTNEILRLKWRPQPAEQIVLMLGSRTRNGLHALTQLIDSSCDDQVAVLTRAFVEVALDAPYLLSDTARHVAKGAGQVLSSKDKARLFNDYKLIKKSQIGSSFDLADKADLESKLAFRKSKGIRSKGSWHGATQEMVLVELREAALPSNSSPVVVSAGAVLDTDTERLEQIYTLFKQFSFLAHTNPYEQFYFENSRFDVGPRVQLRAGVEVREFTGIAAMAIIEVFMRWHLVIAPVFLHDDVVRTAIELLRKLPAVRTTG